MPHEFTDDLAWSEQNAHAPWWQDVYEARFGQGITLVSHTQDGDHQRLGIDRTIVLPNGAIYTADEKVRRKDYGDIALEEWSAEGRTPGWVVKPLLCDLITYVIMSPTADVCERVKAFFLPVVAVQWAWRNYGEEWKRTYGTRASENPGYRSINCCVPVEVLFPAMGCSLRCEVKL